MPGLSPLINSSQEVTSSAPPASSLPTSHPRCSPLPHRYALCRRGHNPMSSPWAKFLMRRWKFSNGWLYPQFSAASQYLKVKGRPQRGWHRSLAPSEKIEDPEIMIIIVSLRLIVHNTKISQIPLVYRSFTFRPNTYHKKKSISFIFFPTK